MIYRSKTIGPETEVITEADCSRSRFLTLFDAEDVFTTRSVGRDGVGGNCWKRVPIRSPKIL